MWKEWVRRGWIWQLVWSSSSSLGRRSWKIQEKMNGWITRRPPEDATLTTASRWQGKVESCYDDIARSTRPDHVNVKGKLLELYVLCACACVCDNYNSQPFRYIFSALRVMLRSLLYCVSIVSLPVSNTCDG